MNPETRRPNDLRNANILWYILGQYTSYMDYKHRLLSTFYHKVFAYLVDKKGAPTECITLKKSAK